MWDAATGELVQTLQGHSHIVMAVSWSADGARLAAGSCDKTVKVWDAATGEVVQTLKGHSDEVNAVSFSPDGTRLASGSWDVTVKVWDAATGEVVHTLQGPCMQTSAVGQHEHACMSTAAVVAHGASCPASCPSAGTHPSLGSRSTSAARSQQRVGVYRPDKVSNTLRAQGLKASAVSRRVAVMRKSDSFLHLPPDFTNPPL